MAAVGTWGWARTTGGALSRVDELRYTLAMARALVTVGRPGVPRVDGPGLDLAESPPDSAFARAAYAEARELSSPVLLRHCLRAWLYADLLGQARRVRHDPELLYVSCLLHDLGLTETHRLRRTRCFAVEGAVAAVELADSHGYPRAVDLADAISLHLNVTVPVSRGPEAHLLHAGTTTDVLGFGLPELPGAAVDEVLARHPREGWADELASAARAQVTARPRSRIALLERRAGFTARVRRALEPAPPRSP